jgi:hypothetical protein
MPGMAVVDLIRALRSASRSPRILVLSVHPERHYARPKTVRTYRSRILEKTGIRSAAELIFYAVQNGLVGPALAEGQPRGDEPAPEPAARAGLRRRGGLAGGRLSWRGHADGSARAGSRARGLDPSPAGAA